MNPFVSVIIPAYNHSKYIENAVTSVLEQSYQNFEIVIINDGSTDDTDSVCRAISGRDPRIFYTSQANQGAHNTINRGICISSGDYVCILNSDDRFYPDKLERCVDVMAESPDTDLISGKIVFVDEGDRPLESGIEIDWLERAFSFFEKSKLVALSVLNENFIATTSNMFFKKGLWQKNQGFQNLRYCHDLDFLIQSFKNGKFYFDRVNPHVQYRTHSSNTIKEDISNVRIEIAAVIAGALFWNKGDVIGHPDYEHARYMHEFLNNKGLSGLIVYMMAVCAQVNNRDELYANLQNEDFIKSCKCFL